MSKNIDYNVGQIYQDMELYLIQSMKRNLYGHQKMELEEGFQWPQWQAQKLKEIKRFQRQNADTIGYYGNLVDESISQQLKEQFREGNKHAQQDFKTALKKGFKYNKKMSKSFFKINDRNVNGLIDSINNDFNIANNATLRMINDEYRQIIHKAALFSTSGAMTPKQAIDMATKDFLSRGLNSIEYSNGTRVNIANYAKMAVNTANQRAYLKGEGEFRKKIGNPLIKISKHGTACKLCQPWEGRILIDDVYSGGSSKDGKYMLLSAAMDQGLYHPNCRHGLNTYYPELEGIKFDDDGPDSQTMANYIEDLNYCNLQIQKYNRLSIGSLDEQNIKYYSDKMGEWEDKKESLLFKNARLKEITSQAKNLLPTAFIESTKGVKISMDDNNYSAFMSDENKIVLSSKSDVYDLIHELGHKYDIQNNLYKDKEFVKIIKEKFKKYSKNDFRVVNSKNGEYYVLKDTTEFVSKYQTRIYSGGFSFFGSKVNVDYAREYFTEGLSYYFKDNKLLFEKDRPLYNYIKKIMGD